MYFYNSWLHWVFAFVLSLLLLLVAVCGLLIAVTSLVAEQGLP